MVIPIVICTLTHSKSHDPCTVDHMIYTIYTILWEAENFQQYHNVSSAKF